MTAVAHVYKRIHNRVYPTEVTVELIMIAGSIFLQSADCPQGVYECDDWEIVKVAINRKCIM